MSRKTLEELGSNWHKLFEYLTETGTYVETKEDNNLFEECLSINVYVTCQIVIYCRTVLQTDVILSSKVCVAIASHLSGLDFGKAFYEKVLLTPGDMHFIFTTLKNTAPYKSKLTSAMKKGFKSKIESLTAEEVLSYRYYLIDIINLTHPISSNPKQIYNLRGKDYYALDIVMQGIEVPEVKFPKVLKNTLEVSPEEHFQNIINIKL